jgi:hypothetical protein
MTRFDFILICESHGVNPNLVMEREDVRQILILDKGENKPVAIEKLRAIIMAEF